MPLSNAHKPVQRPITPVLDEMIDDFEGLDSDETMEKDEVEMKLEKMVFGDKAGFHEGLKSHRDASTDLRDLVDGDRQQAQDGLGEGNLEGLDDTDVCKVQLPIGLAFAHVLPAVFPRLHSVRYACPRPFTPIEFRPRHDVVRRRQRRGMG